MNRLIGRTVHGDDVFATDEVAEMLDSVKRTNAATIFFQDKPLKDCDDEFVAAGGLTDEECDGSGTVERPNPPRAMICLGNGKMRPLSPEERSALDHAADSLGTFVCPGCGGTFWVIEACGSTNTKGHRCANCYGKAKP